MTSKRRTDDFEDDGRVIADMSAVERPSLVGHLPGRRGTGPQAPDAREPRRPKVELTTKERVWMALGALKAGLTIGCIYVVVIGLAIAVLLGIWTFLQG